jgi:hypothetical protein
MGSRRGPIVVRPSGKRKGRTVNDPTEFFRAESRPAGAAELARRHL